MTNEFILNTPEYKRVLEVIKLLKKQQQIALQDIQTLRSLKLQSLEHPESFIRQILGKEKKTPPRQNILPVPYISFDRFLSRSSVSSTSNGSSNESTNVISNNNNNNNSEQDHSNGSNPSFVPKEIKLEPGVMPSSVPIQRVPSNSKVLSTNQPIRPAPIPSLQSNHFQKSKVSSATGRLQNSFTSPVKTENGNTTKISKLSSQSNGNINFKEEKRDESKDENKLNKPKSHNQHWTEEEQKKLEELLVIYPEEEVSAQRWKKISSHLPNRIPKQVASRVQKYFAKLEKMGKPLPGAMDVDKRRKLDKISKPSPSPIPKPHIPSTPKPNLPQEPNSNNNNNTNNIGPVAQTQFKKIEFGEKPSKRQKAQQALMEGKYYQQPLVMMSDDESDDDNIEEDEEFKELGLDVSQVKDTEEFKELVELLKGQRRLKKPKPNERVLNKSEIQPEHEGFSCDACLMDPIIGNLYSCINCAKDDEVDLCETCHNKGEFENEKHKKDHKFNKIERPEEDKPYFLQYNYEYKGSEEERYLTY